MYNWSIWLIVIIQKMITRAGLKKSSLRCWPSPEGEKKLHLAFTDQVKQVRFKASYLEADNQPHNSESHKHYSKTKKQENINNHFKLAANGLWRSAGRMLDSVQWPKNPKWPSFGFVTRVHRYDCTCKITSLYVQWLRFVVTLVNRQTDTEIVQWTTQYDSASWATNY